MHLFNYSNELSSSWLLCTRHKASLQGTERVINWPGERVDSSKLTTLDSTAYLKSPFRYFRRGSSPWNWTELSLVQPSSSQVTLNSYTGVYRCSTFYSFPRYRGMFVTSGYVQIQLRQEVITVNQIDYFIYLIVFGGIINDPLCLIWVKEQIRQA